MATVSEGLKIEQGWFEKTQEVCVKSLSNEETVSDTLESVGKWVRDEELSSDHELTRYEKKLLFAGMIIGSMHTEARIESERKKSMVLEMLAKELGIDPEDLKRSTGL